MEVNNKVMFVVNPVSGGGRTSKKWQEVEKGLKSKGYCFEVVFTEWPMQACQITSEALQNGYNHIIAVGGDGTINEVLNGFYRAVNQGERKAALSVIPMGTGSDFARILPISTSIDYIEKLLTNSQEQACDVVRASYTDWDGNPGTRYYINVADVGIGSDTVIRVNNSSKAMGGFLSFLIAFLSTVYFFKSPIFTVEVDGEIIYTGKSSMVAINNGKYFGGGMMIAPRAQIDDGYIDVTILEDMHAIEFLMALPSVYKGNHLSHPKIRLARGKEVNIKSSRKVSLEVDGESPGVGDVFLQVLPADLRLLV